MPIKTDNHEPTYAAVRDLETHITALVRLVENQKNTIAALADANAALKATKERLEVRLAMSH